VDLAAQVMLASSKDSLEHLKVARRFFELGMVRGAAERASPEDIAMLEATLSTQRQYLGQADAFINADMKLHTQIAAMSGNPIFEAVSEAMLHWLKEYHTEMLIWTGRERYTLAEHEEIIGRIAAHDPDGAEKAMIKHLDRSAALYAHQDTKAG